MTERKTACIAAVFSLIFILSGCSTSASDRDSVNKVFLIGNDPRIVVHGDTGGGEALLNGQLVYDPVSKCLRISNLDRRSNGIIFPVWPKGSEPLNRNGKRGVDVPGSGVVADGDTLKIAGGYADWSQSTPPGLSIPNACMLDGIEYSVFAVNPLESIIRQ